MAELNGKALSAIGVGIILVWSGVKGWSVLGVFRDLIAGRPPSNTGEAFLTPSRSDLMSGSPDEDRSPLLRGSGDVAGTALQGVGHAYRFGGAPGKDGTKPWDCSSMVNWVVGTKLGRAIPGYGPGKYDGSSHGPTTFIWGVWLSGLQKLNRNEVAAGDIIVWTDHMGIAVDNGNMISAHNPAIGTTVTPIDGHGNGPLMLYGRLKG